MLKISKFKSLLSGNFGFTALAKASDLVLKFGILLFFMTFRGNEDLVQYTYFLSLGGIMGAIFDWGGARYNVRQMIDKGVLPLNFLSVVLSAVSFLIIYKFQFIKIYNLSFLIHCIVYGVTLGWINTFVKYYEYINKNKVLYKFQVFINLTCSVLISILIILGLDLLYAFEILIIGNIAIIVICFTINKGNVKFIFSPTLLYNGLPFLINTLAVMAFSQINIVIINQFGTDYEISNFVLAQRIMEVTLMLPNSYTSSVIGKFFKGEVIMKEIQGKTLKLWLGSSCLCFIITLAVMYLYPKYNIVVYLFVLLLPLGFVRSMSMSYSVILDYTKYYLVRTVSICFILILNLLLAKYIIQLPYGLYWFSIYIGVLISLLIIVYKVTFKKYNIYEMFHS
ncbi:MULTISPECIES: hypothetical protein [Sphingobacterium]|uniref:hypothetical protein n=1 Tax=Sphingobacterium TaxID=28453 RepID=UPI00104C8AFC|nr:MULTISPECIES: hypothetical protein [Sphingobacterium]MCW2262038.1 O-antigen/teichoic acid export membrane protein [Sphingobacterium kitahiroshimense]NJI75005.1 hypothetical protein [Sphingobacterium sp. B16(2022)]